MDGTDVEYLRRAIRLAMTGRGRVEPNPMVGCVIVKDERIIGEGIHGEFGGPHAEPNALASCIESPSGATAYVTLEPCCHANKKTPPCVPRLIEAKIARVVVGCVDPNPEVDGKGLAMLRDAGIDVITGADSATGDSATEVAQPVAAECRQLLAPFIARTVFHRPYITLKWAQTANGKVAGARGARMQISNSAATRAVHQLRARSDAILVGVNTVINDDPMLNARGVEASRLGLRIILDSNLRTPVKSRFAETANELPVDLYFSREGFIATSPQRIKELMATGIQLIATEQGPDGRISLPKLLERDGFHDITHLLVEPGPTLARGCFDAGAADRVWVIRSAKSTDAPDAPNAPQLPARYHKTGEIDLDGDVLSEYLDTESDLFFAAVPSADLVLTSELCANSVPGKKD